MILASWFMWRAMIHDSFFLLRVAGYMIIDSRFMLCDSWFMRHES